MTSSTAVRKTSREWRLVRRPDGAPSSSDAECVEVDLREPGPGEVVVENHALSVEPYMRGLMEESSSYGEPYALDTPMHGRAVGVVRESRSDELAVGSLVLHQAGWRELSVVEASSCSVLPASSLPADVHLGALGNTGFTAWVGLTRIADAGRGDTVFVSSAAGGVGSVAVQIARQRGCTVIGSAGGPEKVAWLRDHLEVDAAFDHRAVRPRDGLRHCLDELDEDGIDVYFDNVGGEQLEAAIRTLREGATVVLCGMISIYNRQTPAPGPRNLIRLIWTRSRMEGFLIKDWAEQRPAFEAEMIQWLESGAVSSTTSVLGVGIEQAFDAFLQLLDGSATGKAVVDLGGDGQSVAASPTACSS